MTGRRGSATVAVITAVALIGCSSGRSAPADADVAARTCSALRQINNRVVDVVNESVDDIGAAAADERLEPVVDALGEVRAELLAWDQEIDELDLPAGDEGRILIRQLHAGAAAALDELDRRAEGLEATVTVADDEVGGFVGGWFNSVEKVVSSLEPEIFRFERRDLKQAFLDDPACRNVIQQFVND